MTRHQTAVISFIAALAVSGIAAAEPVKDILNIPKVLQDLQQNMQMMQKTKQSRGLNDLMQQTLGLPGAAGEQNLGYLKESAQLQDAATFFPNIAMPDGGNATDPKSLLEGRRTVGRLYFSLKGASELTPAAQQAYEIARSDSERRAAIDAYALAITNRNAATKANDQLDALAEKAAAAPNTRADLQANHAAMIASVHALGRTQAALASLLQVTAAETLRKQPIVKGAATSTANAQ